MYDIIAYAFFGRIASWLILQRLQSNLYAYTSLSGALVGIARQGPSELLRGFLASSLRDAPYAGLFVVFYEGIKKEMGEPSFYSFSFRFASFHFILRFWELIVILIH